MQYFAGVDLQLLNNLLEINDPNCWIYINEFRENLYNRFVQRSKICSSLAEYVQTIPAIQTALQELSSWLATNNNPDKLDKIKTAKLYSALQTRIYRISQIDYAVFNSEEIPYILALQVCAYMEYLSAFWIAKPNCPVLQQLYDYSLRKLRKTLQEFLELPDPDPNAQKLPTPQYMLRAS